MLTTTQQKKKYPTASKQALQPSVRAEHIEAICNTKFLGVQLDENLTWKNQIKSVTEKSSLANGLLNYAKYVFPEAIVTTLYTSIVERHFQYCCSVWGSCNSTNILQLQRLQNRAARIVANSQFDAPSKPLIQSLGWKTIQVLINRQVSLTVLKFLNSIAPKRLCDIFTKNTVNATRSLRNTTTGLRLPLKSSGDGQNCFLFRGAKCWNGLATEAKQTTSIKAFKCLI